MITDIKQIGLCERCIKNKAEYLVTGQSGNFIKKTGVLLLCKDCLEAAKKREAAIREQVTINPEKMGF